MKIIIAGCGSVGYALAKQLNEEGHDLTLIDNCAERLQPALSNLDVQGVVGNASSFFTLQEAGIEHADLLITVTDKDEVNMISCVIAKKNRKCRTIARVRNPEYFRESNYLKDCMDISMIINPEFAAATEIAQLIQVPDAMDIDSFAKGKVDLMQVVITEDSPLHNMKVQDFSRKLNHEILICILVHDHQVCIPNGNSVLMAGDTISIILPREKINSFYRLSKLAVIKEIKDVMIAGGGMVSYYLTNMLLKSGIEVKLIEKDRARCDFLSDALPKATVIYSNETDHDLLQEEGIEKTDAFVTLTPMDEENIFLSLFANKMNGGCKKITQVNRLALDEIVNDLPIGSMISPKDITTEYILQYVRSQNNSYGSNVEALYRLMDNRVEALEFLVKEDCTVTDIPLLDLNLKKNLLICCIVRNGRIITPSGRDLIQKGDKVIVVTTHKGLTDISDILDDSVK